METTDVWFVHRKTILPAVKRLEGDEKAYTTTIEVAFRFELLDQNQGQDEPKQDLSNNESDPDLSKRVLSLAASNEPNPIYAFLPTRISAYKFVINGDFVVTSNREALKENNDYNSCLLQEYVTLIADVFKTFARRLDSTNQTSDESSECFTSFLKISSRFDLSVSPSILISLLPRPQSSTYKEIKELGELICRELKLVRLFLSSGGKYCHASEILCVSSLPSIVRSVVPEDMLFKFTSKRYPDESLELDDSVINSFSIEIIHDRRESGSLFPNEI